MHRTLVLSALLWAALVQVAGAQGGRAPSIGYVFPAGGRRGTTVEVTVGGQNLNNPTQVLMLAKGIQATIVRYYKPPTRGQLVQINQKLQEYRKKNPPAEGQAGRGRIEPEVFQEIVSSMGLKQLDLPGFLELGRKLRDPNHQPSPQIEELVFLKIAIDEKAPLGKVELRLRTGLGLTNPLYLQVGPWREVMEQEPNDEQPDDRIGEDLPVLINGQILPGDVDRFAFRAKKGTRLVARVAARELMPYLADAVPGWFQATLALYDSTGVRLAYVDDFQFEPDPALYLEIPADGTYILEIKDSIFRGREDFVYRIALGRIPLVTGIFPLGGKVGEETKVRVQGFNLPAGTLTVDGREKQPGVLSLVVDRADSTRPFALDTLDELLEKEPNDRLPQAQAISLPVLINGRIGKPGDRDLFTFQGKAGELVVAEVQARRLGSPLDSFLRITDHEGRLLAFNDDHPDPATGLITHHADSWLQFRLPADGTYSIQLQDAQNRGGEAYSYRLRVTPPRPDFALRLVPASITARAGATIPVTVHAVRRDGFSGEIQLALDQEPKGFALSGGVIPAGLDRVRMTLSMPLVGSPDAHALQLYGWAEIDGRRLERPAVPCQDMMQAFLYRHLVPADQWLIQVQGRGGRQPSLGYTCALPVRIPLGGRVPVGIAGPKGTWPGKLEVELDEGPEGLSIGEFQVDPRGAASFVLTADRQKARVGLKGNLIVNAFQVRMVPDPRKKGTEVERRISLGTLPALPFEVVGFSL